MFDVTLEKVNDNITIHILNFEDLGVEVKKFLDIHFVSICEGNSGSDLSLVKQIVQKFLSSKDERTQMGATAEFFIHLYLKSIGFKQECLFLNLEEQSIKKGFDGYYSLDSEEFIMESKSGSSKTESISHKDKINEAYKDLKNALAGKKTKNNPWKNAYNHALLRTVNTSDSIVKNMKKLSDDFYLSMFRDIKDFNIIPSSTIFLEDIWIDDYSESITDELKALVEKFEFENINVICVTKKSLKLFNTYLES